MRTLKLKIRKLGLTIAVASLALCPALSLVTPSPAEADTTTRGQWLSGDFHQHTYYTDGSTTFDFVMEMSNEYGLDWWANSEHGGSRNRNGDGDFWDTLVPPVTILGDVASSGDHRVMWRWQSLRDFVFPDIVRNRALYPDKKIFSGLEWNVPGHEHCSTGIVAKDASAISAFEYQFDKSDTDKSRTGEVTPYGTLVKQNGRDPLQVSKTDGLDRHADAVAACQWMQDQYKPKQHKGKRTIENGWIVFAHIERAGAFKTGSSDGGYNIEHFRDFNNAGPDVCFGFEGAPGHQVNYEGRGGFGTGAVGGGTYGGVGYYTATVGGLWDALLGEGRRWFNYASSDYHKHWTNCDKSTDCGDDFYPGEYQKTYVYALDANRDRDYSLNEIANGLRSGNAYFVHGDLINHLEFTARSRFQQASMGGELHIKDWRWFREPLVLTIKFKSPNLNNHCVNNQCDIPMVNHVDLIAGNITGKVDLKSLDYTKDTNETTKVIASFTAADWRTDREGYNVITYRIWDLDESMYFRLRGTNLACGVQDETGPAAALPSAEHCNPLADRLINTSAGPAAQAEAAWNDLWFYSNPIFVYVK